jgi:hypothetical protein
MVSVPPFRVKLSSEEMLATVWVPVSKRTPAIERFGMQTKSPDAGSVSPLQFAATSHFVPVPAGPASKVFVAPGQPTAEKSVARSVSRSAVVRRSTSPAAGAPNPVTPV